MILAHAPAGYLLTRILSRSLFKRRVDPKRSDSTYQVLMAAGIIGAVAPDFDFLYYFYIDAARISHHSYVTHMPAFWVGVMIVSCSIGFLLKKFRVSAVAITFCLSALVHLFCDTLTGEIYWLYPLKTTGFNFIAIADVQTHWVLRYMQHWTFLAEVAIISVAMIVFLRLKETAVVVMELYRQSARLRAATFRIGVCTFGIALVALFGIHRFNLDDRILDKVASLKSRVVQKIATM